MSEKRIRSSNWGLIFGVPIAGTSPISDVGVAYPNINLTFSWSSLIWYISPDKYFLGTVLISLFPFPGMMVFLYWRWNNQRSSRWMPEDRSCINDIPHCFLLLLCQFLFVDIFLLWTLPLPMIEYRHCLYSFLLSRLLSMLLFPNLFRTVLHLHHLSLCLCFLEVPFWYVSLICMCSHTDTASL